MQNIQQFVKQESFPVTHQRSFSAIFLVFTHPGSRISDPGSKNSNKREGLKKNCHNFLCSHKFHKIANYFRFKVLKKKNLSQFSKNYRTFYPKNCR
jgi:hypothetical protein